MPPTAPVRRSLLVLAVVLASLPAVAGGAPLENHQSGDDCAFPTTRSDATGTAVSIEADPDRVVALHASAAQTMWEIGASEEVVGMPVNQYTSYLDGYERPENVVAADGFSTNVEAVVALEADLVLAPNVTPTDTVTRLRAANQTVYHFREARTIEDVYAKTLLTGQLTGNCDGAAERTARMRVRIDRVRQAVAGETRPTVIYPLGGGVVAGNGTFLHELIRTAGGRNLAAEAGIEGYAQISPEVIVSEPQPQWLILNDELPRSAVQMDAYNETPAVQDGQIVRMNPDYANQPAPRTTIVVEQLARALHPEAMSAVNGTTTPGAGDDPPTTTSAPPTSTAGQPGLGVVTGVLSLLVALLAVRSRRRP